MYKVDITGKRLTKLDPKKFLDIGAKERFDIEEWIAKSPDVLGEDLLVIQKELPLPSGIRLDILAIDRDANLVIIELKRDLSGCDVEWQAIKYASYCSNFISTDIFSYFAKYLGSEENIDIAKEKIGEFIDEDLDNLNQNQRIILVAREFHSDVISAVLWLRDNYEVEIKCIRLQIYEDENGGLFLNPEVIIPLPEAEDYVERKQVKEKESRRSLSSSFSLEKGNFEYSDLKNRLNATLNRPGDLTPRLVVLMKILLTEDRVFRREEIKEKLFEKKVGSDIGRTGAYLSNLSQFLTKKSNPHLRQVIEFTTDGEHGQMKDNYKITSEYRGLLKSLIDERGFDNAS